MAWRLAKSLEQLRNQVNGTYPNRSKVSDGTIGNAAHAATASDHNPNSKGVVCALDLTHDPASGFDAHKLAETLITHRHPNLKYVISNSRIAGAWTGWKWQRYTGSNPHSKHIHVSVGNNSDGRSTGNYDDTSNWNIGQGGSTMAEKINLGTARILAETILGRDRNATHAGVGDADLMANHVNQDLTNGRVAQLWQSAEASAAVKHREAQAAFYNKYSKLVGELESRPTKAQLEEVAAKLAAESAKVAKAEEALKAEQAKKSEDTVLLDEAGSWFTKLFNRLFKKG